MALFAAIAVAALAACAGETDDEDFDADDAELKALELNCKSGGVKFDVKASKGTLDTGAFTTSFTCSVPKADAGKAAALSCTEKAQKVHAGKWEATFTKSGATYKATLKRGNAGDLAMTCTAPSPADAGAADAAPPSPAVASYAEMAPVLEATCGPCHGATFGTIDQLRKRKTQMLDALLHQRMPRNNPAWSLGDDGKKLIAFLQSSKEL